MGWEAFRIVRINAQPTVLQRVLANVPAWPEWDVDLAKVNLDHPEAVASGKLEGEGGILDMKFGRSFRFKIEEARLGFASYSTPLPGAHAVWYWDYSKHDETGMDLKFGVQVTGWASTVYKWVLEKQCLDAFDAGNANLKRICEQPPSA
eukprot:jgi/Hompol1/5675/HPOL_004647-RA